MRSSIGIDVAAPAEVVFDLARDVNRWKHLLPHYRRSGRVRVDPDGVPVVAFVAIRPVVAGVGIPVAWRSRCWPEPDGPGLRFVHVAGVTRGMAVTWRIEPAAAVGGRCHVTIEHDFRPRLPGLAWFVDRWFTRAIAGRTLATFKALAEANVATQLADAPPTVTAARPDRP
jgi:ribosome-associated toxin RatA of RatAB toxin-antitoxin module